MEIKWHGNTCVTIKGKKVLVVFDPYAKPHVDAGHKLSKTDADIVLLTDDYKDEAALIEGAEELKGTNNVINWPGEYELNGVAVTAIANFTKEHTEGDTLKGKILVFSMLVDGIRIAHLGKLGLKPDEEMATKIGDVDVLFIPIGGENSYDAKEAHGVIETIEPSIVVPVNYTDEELEKFIKEVGLGQVEARDELEVGSRSSLQLENTQFVILNAV